MVACGAFFSLRVLVSKCMHTSRWWCVSCGNMKLFVAFFTRYRMPLLGAFSCRPSVSPEPSAARMPLLMLWLSPTGSCCRERQNSIFVLEYTSRHVWFLYRNYYTIKKRQLWDRGCHRNSSLQAAWDTPILYEAKQGCGVVSRTTFSYWGACWSKVLVLIWYHMYVREDCYVWFFIETRMLFF